MIPSISVNNRVTRVDNLQKMAFVSLIYLRDEFVLPQMTTLKENTGFQQAGSSEVCGACKHLVKLN